MFSRGTVVDGGFLWVASWRSLKRFGGMMAPLWSLSPKPTPRSMRMWVTQLMATTAKGADCRTADATSIKELLVIH